MSCRGRSFAPLRVLALGVVLWCSLAMPTDARVEIILDAATLNDFLSAVTPPAILLALPNGHQISLEIHNLRVIGFDPSAGSGGRGNILTSLEVAIPALGLRFPLEPRLSLEVQEEKGEKICVLRFEKMEVPLPVTGALDVSGLVPTYRVPTDAAWTLPMRQGEVHVKSRLLDTRMGADAIRLGFDIELKK